jgi:SAM-dependent methyltransferase
MSFWTGYYFIGKIRGNSYRSRFIGQSDNAGKCFGSTNECFAANFICCDIYDLPNHLNQQFDVVFTSYGTIGWLPDLNKWAAVIQQFLKPGGQFVFVEFHPVVWMYDDDFSKVGYNYFNTGPIVENESGTYADRDAAIQQDYIMWNHGLAEVFTACNPKRINHYNFSGI